MTGTVSTITSAKGTPGFQPPGLLQTSPIRSSCDIYALGAVIIELFSGVAVWEKLPLMTIFTNVVVKKLY